MLPSLVSEAVAEQVSSDPTTTLLLGEMFALVVKVGDVFSTVTESELVTLSLFESVAVAVQVMVSPTSVSVAVTV